MSTVLPQSPVVPTRKRAEELLAPYETMDAPTRQRISDVVGNPDAKWDDAYNAIFRSQVLNKDTKQALWDEWRNSKPLDRSKIPPLSTPSPMAVKDPGIIGKALGTAGAVAGSVTDALGTTADYQAAKARENAASASPYRLPPMPPETAAPVAKTRMRPITPNAPVALEGLMPQPPDIVKPAVPTGRTPKPMGIHGNALVMDDGTEMVTSIENQRIYLQSGLPRLSDQDVASLQTTQKLPQSPDAQLPAPFKPTEVEPPEELLTRLRSQEVAAFHELHPGGLHGVEPQLTGLDAYKNIAAVVAQNVANIPADIAQGAAIAFRNFISPQYDWLERPEGPHTLRGFGGKETKEVIPSTPPQLSVEETPLYKFGTGMRAASSEVYPENPRLAGSFWLSQVPQGLASMGTMLAANFVGGPAAGMSLMGAQMGAQAYQEALDATHDPAKAFKAFMANLLVSTTEQIPVSHLFSRLEKLKGAGILEIAKQAGIQGGEEFIQEGFQQLLTDLDAIHLSGYKPNMSLPEVLKDVATNAAVGGIAGVLTGGGAGAVPALRGHAQTQPVTSPPPIAPPSAAPPPPVSFAPVGVFQGKAVYADGRLSANPIAVTTAREYKLPEMDQAAIDGLVQAADAGAASMMAPPQPPTGEESSLPIIPPTVLDPDNVLGQLSPQLQATLEGPPTVTTSRGGQILDQMPGPPEGIPPKPIGTAEEPEVLPASELSNELGPRWYINRDLGSLEEEAGKYWLDGTSEEDANAGISQKNDGGFIVELRDGRKLGPFDTLQMAARVAETVTPQGAATPTPPKALEPKPPIHAPAPELGPTIKEEGGELTVSVAGESRMPKEQLIAAAKEELRKSGRNPDEWDVTSTVAEIIPTRGGVTTANHRVVFERKAAETPKTSGQVMTDDEAYHAITKAGGNPDGPSREMVSRGFPVEEIIKEQVKPGFGYFYNEWKAKQQGTEAPKEPVAPKANQAADLPGILGGIGKGISEGYAKSIAQRLADPKYKDDIEGAVNIARSKKIPMREQFIINVAHRGYTSFDDIQKANELFGKTVPTVGFNETLDEHFPFKTQEAPSAPVAPAGKFKFEVIADASGQWSGNAKTYATREEAEAAAQDLQSRWYAVQKYRVVPVEEEAQLPNRPEAPPVIDARAEKRPNAIGLHAAQLDSGEWVAKNDGGLVLGGPFDNEAAATQWIEDRGKPKAETPPEKPVQPKASAQFKAGQRVSADEGTGTIHLVYGTKLQQVKLRLDDGSITKWIPATRVTLAESTPALPPNQEAAAPQLPPTPETSEPKTGFGSKNTRYTEDVAEKARQKFRDKLSGKNLSSGIDPELMQAAFELGGYYFEGGVREFAAWSKAMIADVGELVRPYLRGAFAMIEDTFKEEAGKEPELDYKELTGKIRDMLLRGEAIDNPKLTALANEAFGGTRGEGKYDPKDAYDAAEAAINMVVGQQGFINFDDIAGTLQRLKDLEKLIPRQADRTEEQIELQQFSTPPAEAFAAVLATGLRKGMIGLEPSAGTGNIAVIAKATGADILTNEIAPRRRSILEMLGFKAFDVDAQYLNNLLPIEIEPDVVIMNPPFSSTGGRTKGHDTKYGAEHVTQALARLKNGGRLVAIVGRGMAHGRENFDNWWQQIENKYNVRANIGIDGKYYGKYGTGFDNQIIVIDKNGPTPGTTRADKLKSITRAENLSPEEAIGFLKSIGEEDVHGRIQRLFESAKPKSPESTQSGIRRPTGSRNPATPGVNLGGAQGRPDRSSQPRSPSTGAGSETLGPVDETGAQVGTGSAAGTVRSDAAGERAGTEQPGGLANVGEPVGDVNAGRTGSGSSALTLGHGETGVGEAETDLHNKYVIQKARFDDSVKHPADIVESTVLASVPPPDVTYQPQLPLNVVQEGRISDVQLEAVTYAGQRHATILHNRRRAGFWIGDGTGLGKGREAAAIIYDNLQKGRKKAAWFSLSHQLRVDAQRDLDGVGVPLKIVAQQDFKDGDKIDAQQGVLFTTYGLAAQSFNSDQKRFRQIVEWLGDDFDGVIVFDESHAMKNSVVTGIGGVTSADDGTQAGKMGLKLDEMLPNARIVYVSATAATVPRNMGYMGRLGLWGAGSPFPDFMDFLSAIGSGGIGAMEMLSRDLKAVGSYVSRLISYKGIQYDKVTHELTPDEIGQYNTMADLWLTLQNEFAVAAQTAGQTSSRAKAAMLSQFYSAQQRFFLQVMMGYQLPDLFNAAQADLDAGRSVVISLYNTNEGQVKRKVAEAQAAGADLDEMDLTPRELIADLIRKSFPVEQYTTQFNPATQRDEVVQMVDANGNPVLNRENVQKRDELIDSLSEVRVPDNALDAIVNHFGPKNVSEVSGRQKRLEGNQYVRRKIEKVPIKERDATEVKRFQDGTTRVIVITGKASAGISLHSDKSAKNKERRVFYAMQLSWSADKQMQSFGRVHRSSQEEPPIIKLVQTNLRGQERLTNTVASRLASLGAITEGSRESKGGQLFSVMDITDQYGEGALMQMWRDAVMDRVPGIVSGPQLLQRMGVIDGNGNIKDSDATNVDRFLNRILGLHVDEQNAMFEHFFALFNTAVASARESGTFDTGVEQVDAANIQLVSKEEVYKHPGSNAKTELVSLNGDFKLSPWSWSDIAAKIKDNAQFHDFIRNIRSGKLYAGFIDTDLKGQPHIYLYSPKHGFDHAITLTEGRENFEAVKADAAQTAWTQEYESTPKTETRPIYLISGAVFPIYDKVFEGSSYGHKVVRAIAADGKPYIGIRLASKDIPNLKQRLGIGTPLAQSTPEDIYKMVENRSVIELDNGWEVRLTTVHGEPRMELDPKGNYNRDELTNAQLIAETIEYKKRWFVPLDDDSGPVVLGNILALHKAVRDKTSGTPPPRPATTPRKKKDKIQAAIPPSTPDGPPSPLSARPTVLPLPPTTVGSKTYSSETVQIAVPGQGSQEWNKRPLSAWRVAPGLVVHPQVISGKPRRGEKPAFSVTHDVSGLTAATQDTRDKAIETAEELAKLGDWTRSADEMQADKTFWQRAGEKIRDQRGMATIGMFTVGGPAPQKIPDSQLRDPDQRVEELLTATRRKGSGLWTWIQNAPAEIWAKFGHTFIHEFDVRMHPRFVEMLTRFNDAPLDAARHATRDIKEVLMGLDSSEYDAARRIIVLEDLIQTAEDKGDAFIPGNKGLTLQDLQRAHDGLVSIATPQVIGAVERHNALVTTIAEDLVARGKLQPESIKGRYYPNVVLSYLDEMDGRMPWLPQRLKTPYRYYVKQREGHAGYHDADYVDVMHRYLTKVRLDNMIDDFFAKVSQQFDISTAMTPEQKVAMFSRTGGRPIVGKVYDGPDGKRYQAFQYRPGNMMRPARVVNEGLLEEAILNDALTQEFAVMEDLAGNPSLQPALTLGGKFKIYLLPTEIARRLIEFKTTPSRLFISNALADGTRIWKTITITARALPFHTMNLFGDELTLYAEELGALLKQPEALKLLLAKLPTAEQRDMLDQLEAARVINATSSLASEFHASRPEFDPGLAAITGRRPSMGAKVWAGYMRLGNLREEIPRVALWLHDNQRIQQGKMVRSKGVNIKGLTQVEARDKRARAFNVDYGALSPFMREHVRGWMFPFASYYVKIAPMWARRLAGGGIGKEGVTAKMAGFGTQVGEMGLKFGIPLYLLWLWNNLKFPDEEKDLPEWHRNVPHLITGFRTEEGKPIVLSYQTPLDMALSWTGFDRIPAHLGQVYRGELTMEQAAKEQAKDLFRSPYDRLYNLSNPLFQTLVAMTRNKDPLTGQEIVPAKYMGDRTQHTWPQTDRGQRTMLQFAARNLITPYAQYLRASNLTEPDSGSSILDTLKLLGSGPLNWERAIGRYDVNIEAVRRGEWNESVSMQEALYQEKLADIEDAWIKFNAKDITAAEREQIIRNTRGRPGPQVPDAAIVGRLKTPRVQIQFLRAQLKHTADPNDRKIIQSKIEQLQAQQAKEAFGDVPKVIRPSVGLPPTLAPRLPPTP